MKADVKSSGIAAPIGLTLLKSVKRQQTAEMLNVTSEIEIEHAPYADVYSGTPQQLLDAGLVKQEHLSYLNGGKRSLRLFPDGRTWVERYYCPRESKLPGGRLIQLKNKKLLKVWVWITPEESDKRLAVIHQRLQAARDLEEQAQQRKHLEEAIKEMTDMAKEHIQIAQSELDLPDEELVAQRRRKLREDIAKWESNKRNMIGKLQVKLQALAPCEAQRTPRLSLVYSARQLAS